MLTGTTVTIDHGNGLYTVYNSLESGDDVFVGQKVLQGAEIGAVSVTNRQESAGGAHLHFQVIENGAAIDPADRVALRVERLILIRIVLVLFVDLFRTIVSPERTIPVLYCHPDADGFSACSYGVA